MKINLEKSRSSQKLSLGDLAPDEKIEFEHISSEINALTFDDSPIEPETHALMMLGFISVNGINTEKLKDYTKACFNEAMTYSEQELGKEIDTAVGLQKRILELRRDEMEGKKLASSDNTLLKVLPDRGVNGGPMKLDVDTIDRT